MKKNLITIFILFMAYEVYCQPSYVQDLSSEALIAFPAKPEIQFSDGATYYVYRANNDLYFAQVIDLHRINRDSLDLNSPKDIYAKFITSVIEPLKGEVFYSEKIKMMGLNGVAFNYKCKLKGNIYYGYQQAFLLVNNNIVSYSLLSPDSIARENVKVKSFFNTFKLTPKKAADMNKKSGIMAGFLIIGALAFWGATALYLNNRSRKKKSYEWTSEK
jgi:hypothetical protein